MVEIYQLPFSLSALWASVKETNLYRRKMKLFSLVNNIE